MVCPFCGSPYEGPFCPACGRDAAGSVVSAPMFPPSVCARCGAAYAGPACPYCGTPFGASPAISGLRAAGSVFWTLGMGAYLLLLVACMAAFAYAAVLVVQGALAGGPRYIDLYVLVPFPLGETFDVGAETFVAYFALIAAAIVASYAWYGIRDGRATARAFTRPLADFRARFESRSAWIATGQVFLATLFFQFAFVLVLAAGGYEPSVPEYPTTIPDWYMYYALANASVYEEFVARWLLIGVPLLVGAAVLRVLRGPASVGATPLWRHLFGGTLTRDSPRPLLLAAAILVPLSAVVFGLAHVPSWGWWKFFPTVVAGLGMGYLFVRHGILAGVLFHFATDYLGALSLFVGDDLAGQIVLGIFILALFFLGAFFFAWYFVYAAGLANHFTVRWGLRQPMPVPAKPDLAWGDQVVMKQATRAVWPAYPLWKMFRPPPPPPGYRAPPPSPPDASPGPNARTSPSTPSGGSSWILFTCARCGGQIGRAHV